MKRLCSILLFLSLITAILAGCSVVDDNSAWKEELGARFVCVQRHSGISVWADSETGVMYVRMGTEGGLSVMLDADGNPLVWDFNE